MTDCQYCISNFHRKLELFKDLPRPAEVMLKPPDRLHGLWEEARLHRERYSAALADEIMKHDQDKNSNKEARDEGN